MECSPEELIKQINGDIIAPRIRPRLPLPCQPLYYGSNLVTNHTYRHILTARDPLPYIIFQYTLAGHGEFRNHGKKYDLPPGSAFLTQTPSPTFYLQHPNYDFYHFVYLTIRGEAAMSMAKQIIMRHGNILTFSPNSRSVSMLCQHINELRASDKPFDIYQESIFAYKFLMMLCREHFTESDQGSERMPAPLERATDYIEKHISNPLLDVSDLAREANISKGHLTKLFEKFYFTSPSKYILTRRLSVAAQMLVDYKDLYLKEIIDKCGFSSEAYFCYAYRKMYHDSPGTIK